jgi:hypothetical protein
MQVERQVTNTKAERPSRNARLPYVLRAAAYVVGFGSVSPAVFATFFPNLFRRFIT